MISADDSRYIEVVWTFPSHSASVNRFRMVLSGSQSCASGITSWFVRGENKIGMPSECEVQEAGDENSKICVLTCQCVDPHICDYLHYRVHFTPWDAATLALCHFDMANSGFVNPELVIY